ncbi:MAG: methylated-DNA--[protein]-cysteine S-methyltransferase [Prevotella sp.]|nr:methylated-DNA--[protein]-cysteine S-methyltransferase [Staphylococcus sp.]MCM1349855.1 methylated-DNA--[protein]-cysteine S-methyltransferase [Prevotella sp.]
MIYSKKYKSPLGEITMNSDGEYLTALCFEDGKDYGRYITESEEKDLSIFEETIRWLDIYFQGKDPEFIPKYKRDDITLFRQDVIDEMLQIPYGKTITYNDIAKSIAKKRGLKTMSAQAVGGAVGWNPICIIIPCHRVVGTNGSLTGYGGGIDNKIRLLKLEGVDITKYSIPKKGTAL